MPLTMLFSQPVITHKFSQISDLTTGGGLGTGIISEPRKFARAFHFFCPLSNSPPDTKTHMPPAKLYGWAGNWAVCCEMTPGEHKTCEIQNGISCLHLETLTSQFVLGGHDLVIYCILHGTSHKRIFGISTSPTITLQHYEFKEPSYLQ